MPMTKHMGRMQNTGEKVAVIFRHIYNEDGSIQDDTHSLVVGTDALPLMWADSFMDAIKSSEAQDTIDFFNVATRKTLPDGRFILPALVEEGRMKKVRSNEVIMEPDHNVRIPLDELNRQLVAIAEGKTEDQLGFQTAEAHMAEIDQRDIQAQEQGFEGDEAKARAAQLRTQAAMLHADASRLEEEADGLDPLPKRGRGRPKKVTADVAA